MQAPDGAGGDKPEDRPSLYALSFSISMGKVLGKISYTVESISRRLPGEPS